MRTFIANLSTGTKIGVGFATVLALLVAIAGLGFVTLQHADDALTRVETIGQNAVRVTQIDRDLLEMRRAAAAVAAGDSRQGERMRALRQQVDAAIATAVAQPTLNEERRAMLRELGALVERYQRGVETAAERGTARQRLIDETLAPLGTELAATLDRIAATALADGLVAAVAQAGAAQQAALRFRLEAERYIAAPAQEAAAAANRRLSELGPAFDRLAAVLPPGERQRPVLEAAARLAPYREAFAAVVAATADAERLLAQFNAETGGQMTALIERLRQSQMAAMNQVATRTAAEMHAAEVSLLAGAGIAVLLGGLLAWLIGRAIAGPVRAMTGAMGALAEGKLDTAIPARGRRDEIGRMSDAVQVFKDNALRVRAMEAEAEAQKAKAEADKRAAMQALADRFEASVGDVVKAVAAAATEMQASAQALSATAEQTSRQATAVAAASEEASTNVQTVAASAEELGASISEISRQVASSSQLASGAVDRAGQTNRQVKGLADAVQKIGDVVTLINGIASQTNLLALNATIEAARAGEAGKGFAVVAAEVKSLATQTAKATDEIAAQIAGIQGATGDAVAAIAAIGQAIGEISQVATAIASAVEEQNAATREIARNVQQAAAGTSDVSANIGGVTEAAGQTGSAATQMLAAAQELGHQAERLRRDVDAFVSQVRAA